MYIIRFFINSRTFVFDSERRSVIFLSKNNYLTYVLLQCGITGILRLHTQLRSVLRWLFFRIKKSFTLNDLIMYNKNIKTKFKARGTYNQNWFCFSKLWILTFSEKFCFFTINKLKTVWWIIQKIKINFVFYNEYLKSVGGKTQIRSIALATFETPTNYIKIRIS